MRSRSVALSRLGVLPAGAVGIAVTPLLTSAHCTQSAQSDTPRTPVAAVRALTTDFPAAHATTAHQSALRARFFAGVEQARREDALKQFYAGIQRSRDEAALK